MIFSTFIISTYREIMKQNTFLNLQNSEVLDFIFNVSKNLHEYSINSLYLA
jgi:hypothetical protein